MDRGMTSQASNQNTLDQRTSFFPTGMNGGNMAPTPPAEESQFDIISWYPSYQNCQRFFVNHAQHSGLVQSVSAFINIRLPFQQVPAAITNLPTSSSMPSSPSAIPQYYQPGQPQQPQQQQFNQQPQQQHQQQQQQQQQYSSYVPYSRSTTTLSPAATIPSPSLPFISLIPFIRRLVITGFDNDGIMHGFFGSDWQKGIAPLQEIERRNFLFAAKSSGWAGVKTQYDIAPDQTVPFMKPLARVQLAEIERSEKAWSEWLAMEDWMVGPRAPVDLEGAGSEDGGHERERRNDMMPDDQH